jgi:hypothetical protein
MGEFEVSADGVASPRRRLASALITHAFTWRLPIPMPEELFEVARSVAAA